MRVLVLGGGGQVARAVAAAVPAGQSLLVKAHADLDIADEAAVARAVADARCDWIVNGAAYTAVDQAESRPEEARRINQTAVGILARAASAGRCRLLHLSTDFVFDGRTNCAYLPSASTNPLNVYGSTKLGGEHLALASGSQAIVLRIAWVYASSGKNFALTMLRLMRERNEVRVVSDQIGTPTWATGIAHAIWGLMSAGSAPGLYHWTDLGVASWYDFAVAIQEEALERGLLTRAVPVIPISTSAYPTPAARPVFSVLDTQTVRSILPQLARHWRHNLRKMLDELRAS